MKTRKSLLLIISMILAFSITLCSCTVSKPPTPAATAKTILLEGMPIEYENLKTLADKSSLIVVGHVKGPIDTINTQILLSEKYKKEKHIPSSYLTPVTLYDVEVKDSWKGNMSVGDHITMYMYGGKMKDEIYIASDMTDFQPDQDYLLFLTMPTSSDLKYYRPTTTTQGIVMVADDKIKNKRGNPWFENDESLPKAKEDFSIAK